MESVQIVHGWRRKPRGKWFRVASGTKDEVARKMDEFARKNPQYCDSYTGVNDPNIPAIRRGQ